MMCIVMKFNIYTRLDEETVHRIDALIKKKKFDNRSSFVRRAVIEYLDQFETKVLA